MPSAPITTAVDATKRTIFRVMTFAALAALTLFLLASCAGTPMTLEERCALYQRTIDAMYLRLEDPIYIQNEDNVALAKRIILDAELAMTVRGCPLPAA